MPLRQTARQAYLQPGDLRQLGELWDSAIFKHIWISLICHDTGGGKRWTLRLDTVPPSKRVSSLKKSLQSKRQTNNDYYLNLRTATTNAYCL